MATTKEYHDYIIEYNKPKIWTKNSKNSEFAVL